MTQHIVIIEKEGDFTFADSGCQVVTAREFIHSPPRGSVRGLRVINLCHHYDYLGTGYYCSLLAEARGIRVVPSAEVMLALTWRRLQRAARAELEEQLQKDVARCAPAPEARRLQVYFGDVSDPEFAGLARRTYDAFRCPILVVDLQADPTWQIRAIRPVSVRSLDASGRAELERALDRYAHRRWRPRRPRQTARYSLAVLQDPQEKLPPSDPRALKRLTAVGQDLGIEVEQITRHDLGRLPEFDALFLRETTNLDHHTYRFAKRAQAEGMPVIDDPISILRCSNKVFLAEAFRLGDVPTLRTVILDRSRLLRVEKELGYPLVLKIPDGSFSRGVFKVEDRTALRATAARMFADSELILAQEFMYTKFDWRIGILNHQLLFACQYRMSRNHWQIMKYGKDGRVTEGSHRTVPVGEVPEAVAAAALAAARVVGDGLYGVDVKESPQAVHVMEVNDNPNIWAGVEDAVDKDDLYRALLREFVRRIEAR